MHLGRRRFLRGYLGVSLEMVLALSGASKASPGYKEGIARLQKSHRCVWSAGVLSRGSLGVPGAP